MLAAWHRRPPPTPGDAREPSLADIAAASWRCGLACRPLHFAPTDLANLPLPCILGWDGPAYVVLAEIKENSLLVHDPLRGAIRMTQEEVLAHSHGVALLFDGSETFTRAADANSHRSSSSGRLSINVLEQRSSFPNQQKRRATARKIGRLGVRPSACMQLLGLAIAQEILWLAIPMVAMLLIDDVLMPGDFSSLPMLAGLLVLVGILSAGLRFLSALSMPPILVMRALTRHARWLRRLRLSKPQSAEGAIVHTTVPPVDRGWTAYARYQQRGIQVLCSASAASASVFLALSMAWQLALVNLGVLVLYALIARAGARTEIPLAQRLATERRHHNSLCEELRLRAPLMRRFGMLLARRRGVQRSAVKAAAWALELSQRRAVRRALQGILFAWQSGQLILMGAIWVQAGHLSAGTLILQLMLAWHITRKGAALLDWLCLPEPINEEAARLQNRAATEKANGSTNEPAKDTSTDRGIEAVIDPSSIHAGLHAQKSLAGAARNSDLRRQSVGSSESDTESNADRDLDICVVADPQDDPQDDPSQRNDADSAEDFALVVQSLSFRFPGQRKMLLRELSFGLARSQIMLLAGQSGVGKTTLMRLLAGELDGYRGSIRGIGHAHMNPTLTSKTAIKKLVAVLQGDGLLSGSILDNIALFEQNPQRASVLEAAHRVGAHAEILALPNGYATLIDMHGAPLAHTLRQRILLARALYSRPAVLLLDEATSLLDAASERAFLRELEADRIACLIVSRRLEASSSADFMSVLRLPA